MTSMIRFIEGCVLVAISCLAAFLTVWPPNWAWPHAGPLILQSVVLSIAWVAAFYYNDLYDFRLAEGFSRLLPRVLRSCVVAFALFIVASIVLQAVELIASPNLNTFLVTLAMILFLLLPFRAAARMMQQQGAFGERVVVFGTSALGSKVFEELTKRPDLFPTVIPVAEEPASAQGMNGSVERLKMAIEKLRPDRVIVALAERRNRLPVEYLVQVRLRGVRVENAVDVYERLTRKLAVENLTPSFFLFSDQLPKSALHLGIHRVLSVITAALVLIVSAPLMALIALAVKLDSPGPVFFRQERVGLRGKSFLLYKFRTMRCAEPAGPHTTWQRDDRKRVTRIGRWLRPTRLDELPQCWNVLRGDMNFIGPRPEMAQNVEEMTREIPFYALRHIIRPGITGWAQVKHGYAMTRENVEEKIRYDLYYLRHMCATLDVTILLESVKVVLFGRGNQER